MLASGGMAIIRTLKRLVGHGRVERGAWSVERMREGAARRAAPSEFTLHAPRPTLCALRSALYGIESPLGTEDGTIPLMLRAAGSVSDFRNVTS